MGKLWNRIVRLEDVRPVRHIGASIFVRSAQLVGAVAAESCIIYIKSGPFRIRPLPSTAAF